MASDSKQPITDSEIRKRSYFIWEAEGRPIGREVENWLRAEAELEKETRETNRRAKPVAASKVPASDRRTGRSKTTTPKT